MKIEDLNRAFNKGLRPFVRHDFHPDPDEDVLDVIWSYIVTGTSEGEMIFGKREGPWELSQDTIICGYDVPAGSIVWYSKGRIHRKGAAAIEMPDGSYMWFWRGRLHRATKFGNGPTVHLPWVDVWYRYGKKHRIGHPAEMTDDVLYWYVMGKQHRYILPAVESSFGAEYWHYGNCLSVWDVPVYDSDEY